MLDNDDTAAGLALLAGALIVWCGLLILGLWIWTRP